jgi:hypothetical protein
MSMVEVILSNTTIVHSFSSNIDHANTEEGLLTEQSQHSIGLVCGLLQMILLHPQLINAKELIHCIKFNID